MIEWLSDPATWAALISLTALEIVLGIDNVVFLSVITQNLPPDQARRARQIGLSLALLFRIILLFAITWIIGLKDPISADFLPWLSWRDVILIGGGAFLIIKATQEMHGEIEGEEEEQRTAAGAAAAVSFNAIIAQIVLIDAIFSIDSIVTAVGMADDVRVMIAAVVIAIIVMYLAAEPVSAFIQRHPTTKMLALAFLLLIGMALVADGFGQHIERGYIYAAMGFSVMVEMFNIMAMRRRTAARAGQLRAATATKGMTKVARPAETAAAVRPAAATGKPAQAPAKSPVAAKGSTPKPPAPSAKRASKARKSKPGR